MHKHSLERLNREQVVSESDPFTAGRYRQFAKGLPASTSRILDVGCNTGRGGSEIRRAFPAAQIHGLDLVPERLAKISPGIYDNLAAGLLQDYQPPDGPYDAVLMGELIEHVPYDELDALLAGIQKLLRPGGRLLLTTPNPHYFLLRIRSGGSVLGGPHVSVHCPTALTQYLTYVGFQVGGVKGSGRVSTRVGARLPLMVYGSYLVIARRQPAGPE